MLITGTINGGSGGPGGSSPLDQGDVGGAGGNGGIQSGATASGGAGVFFKSGGTRIVSGFIAGGDSGRANAVTFGAAASKLVLDSGESFNGSVVASTSFTNMLELASAASIGTLTGFGTQFTDFTRITKVMLKLTILSVVDPYTQLIRHKRVQRAVALSSGYSRNDACRLLATNRGMIASFSRADRPPARTAFDAALREAIDEIYQASVHKA